MKKLILLLTVFLGFTFTMAQDKAKSIFDIARTGTVEEVKELMSK